ncbi:MAG: lipase family protein [Candidatus Korobacteraceae bacterium]
MSTPPSNLSCILLNACGAAYDIAPGTCIYSKDAIYSPNVPYTQGPQTACGGTNLINAATVGQCPFGIVVAFRGTLPPSEHDPDSLFDWLQNFFAEPTTCTSGPNKVPGQVHSGFFDATTSIIQNVYTLVSGYNPGPNNPVYIAGHSKGGAMASIAAYILAENLKVPNVQPLVTFASPKPGDINFQGGFQRVLTQTRYENYKDIVPLLPPSTEFIDLVVAVVNLIPYVGAKLAALFKSAENWNYVPVGTMQFITSSFQVISNETVEAQIWDVVEEFGEDLWSEDFSSFGDAHSLLPGKGYNSGVCG